MNVAATTNTSSTADREVVTSRLIDAPRELVFKVWTEAEHVAAWWGPNGFKNTIYEMDVRPGGVMRFTMHGPDGVDYPNKIVFREVVRPERLVYDHTDDEQGVIAFHVTVTFEAEGKKTRLKMCSVFPTAEARDFVVREHGAIEGAVQHLNRLEEYLRAM